MGAVVLLIVSFLSMSSLACSYSSGCSRLKPFEPSINLSSDGVLSVWVMNGAGRGIILNSLNITIDGTKCKVTFPDKGDNNADNFPLPIGAGEVFRVDAECPKEKLNSEILRFQMGTEYEIDVDGSVITRNDPWCTIYAVNGEVVKQIKSKKQFYNGLIILVLSFVVILVIWKYSKRKDFKLKKEIKETIRYSPGKRIFILIFFLLAAFRLGVFSFKSDWCPPSPGREPSYIENLTEFLGYIPEKLFSLLPEVLRSPISNLLESNGILMLVVGIAVYIAYSYLLSCLIVRAIQVLREK